MNISLLQYPIVWTNKAANLHFYNEKLAALAGQTDIAVLPEMFSTGFCIDKTDLAETMQETTVKTIKQWACLYKMVIVGSFMASDNDHLYNRAFFATPEGDFFFADKRHLFSLGNEKKEFTQGTERLIVNYAGIRFCILVCYDLRFPVWSRNVNNEYDVLIYVANFPAKRISDWDILLSARAVENQCYVCGVNCIGKDGLGLEYNGHSTLLDYKANKIIAFADNQADTKTAQLNIEQLQLARQKFPVWQDADTFHITE